jgi:hypothetical protein
MQIAREAMRKTLLILPLLWLAACSDGGEGGEVPEASFSPSAAQPSAASEAPSAAVAAPGMIPAAYLGVWDWSGGACDAASDMRMEIQPDRIAFYESVGTVTAVRAEDGGIAIDLAMEGEGEEWAQTTKLRYSEEGPLLISEMEDPSGNGRLRYKSCPVPAAQ